MGKQPNSNGFNRQAHFLELIRNELITHLQEQGGWISGDNITKIICPSCGKPEAWTKQADPSTIHCNRKNNCGVSTHAKTFAPHLWGNWSERFPPTEEDPHRTAKIYLQSRGLPHNREVIDAVLAAAKGSQRLLREDEILEVVRSVDATAGHPAG